MKTYEVYAAQETGPMQAGAKNSVVVSLSFNIEANSFEEAHEEAMKLLEHIKSKALVFHISELEPDDE